MFEESVNQVEKIEFDYDDEHEHEHDEERARDMSLRIRPILLVIATILVAVSSHAFMEFFGARPSGRNPSGPEGLNDLVDHESRFAGVAGPIADWLTYHSGDTDELNDFLKKFAALKDSTLHVLVRRDNYAIKLERYDGTERTMVADWTMRISEYYEGRGEKAKFEGRKTFVGICINPANQIDLKKLDVPLALDVEAGPEYKDFEKRHNDRRKQQLEKDKARA